MVYKVREEETSVTTKRWKIMTFGMWLGWDYMLRVGFKILYSLLRWHENGRKEVEMKEIKSFFLLE